MMSNNFIVLTIIGSIVIINGDTSDDSRCSPRQSFYESIHASVSELCSQAKLENDASNYDDFKFQYLNRSQDGVSKGDGGYVVAATSHKWAALIGHGLSMSVVYLEPCGLNLPHLHPRASTISYVAQGSIRSGSWSENGGQFHSLTLNKGEGAIFPPGAVHFEQNIGCEPATIVTVFNSADPGTAQLTEAMKALPIDILTASLNCGTATQIDQCRTSFPKTPAKGIASCYQACNIQPKSKTGK